MQAEPANQVCALLHLHSPLLCAVNDRYSCGWQDEVAAPKSPGSPQPQRTESLAALASCVGSSEAELRTLSADELTELVEEAEQGGARIGVLGRKRILAEAQAATEGGSRQSKRLR